MGIDGGLVVDALQGTCGYANALGQPLVIMALAAKFIADKVTYVYLHRGAICAACYRFLEYHSNDRRQKGRRVISSPNCGRGIPLKGKTKILADWRAFATVIL